MWRGLQPAGVSPCKAEPPQAEARATKKRPKFPGVFSEFIEIFSS
jgi:hypothetical protein